MGTVATEEPTPSEPSSRRTPDLRWVLRLILVVGALALLWLAQHRYEVWQERFSSEFKLHPELAVMLGFAIASGLAPAE